VEIPGSKKDDLQMIGFADVGFLGRYQEYMGMDAKSTNMISDIL